MALGFKKPIEPDDPRLQGHGTTYQASRGGHFPPQTQPAQDPRKTEESNR